MVANHDKFRIMFLGLKTDNSKITFAIENKQIKCKREVKLLRITIDEKLTFKKHIADICSLASNKSFGKNKKQNIYLKLTLCQHLNI